MERCQKIHLILVKPKEYSDVKNNCSLFPQFYSFLRTKTHKEAEIMLPRPLVFVHRRPRHRGRRMDEPRKINFDFFLLSFFLFFETEFCSLAAKNLGHFCTRTVPQETHLHSPLRRRQRGTCFRFIFHEYFIPVLLALTQPARFQAKFRLFFASRCMGS